MKEIAVVVFKYFFLFLLSLHVLFVTVYFVNIIDLFTKMLCGFFCLYESDIVRNSK